MAKELDISEVIKHYNENIESINEELDVTESLYDELKIHFDRIKNSTTSGALNFVSKQTPNLIALRKNKIDLLKEKNAVMKSIIDSSIKLQSDEDNSNGDNEIIRQLHDMLLHNNPDVYLKEENSDKVTNMDSLDEQLEARFAEIEEKENEQPVRKKQEKSKKKNYSIVIDEETEELYAVDKDYNILEDVELPDDWIIEFLEDENGDTYAVNQYGEELEIISFEED